MRQDIPTVDERLLRQLHDRWRAGGARTSARGSPDAFDEALAVTSDNPELASIVLARLWALLADAPSRCALVDLSAPPDCVFAHAAACRLSIEGGVPTAASRPARDS